MPVGLNKQGTFLPPELEKVDRSGKGANSDGQYGESPKEFYLDPSSSEPGHFLWIIQNCALNGAEASQPVKNDSNTCTASDIGKNC